MAVLVPVYYNAYGLWHFLWISDVALFVTLIAVWRESRLLNSMMVIGALPFEFVWVADFIAAALGLELLGVTAYMFDHDSPAILRALSLFHLALPPIWIWLLLRWGYDGRALIRQIGLFTAVILATSALSEPQNNINWVFTPVVHGWEWMPQPLWVMIYLVSVPPLIYWPAHKLADKWFAARQRAARSSGASADYNS